MKMLKQAAVFLIWAAAAAAAKQQCVVPCDPEPGTPANAPLGTSHGLKPGRVAWAFDGDACTWSGDVGPAKDNFWWAPSNLNASTVASMLARSLMAVAGAADPISAWDLLFRDFNARYYGEKSRSYKPGDKIAIKINLNGDFGSYVDNNGNGISPQYLHALVSSLVAFGVPPKDIAIYDAARWFTDALYNAVHTDFPAVRLCDNAGQNGREQVVPDMASHLQFSNTSVAAWNVTYLPTIVTEARYVVAVDNFRGHVAAGVTLSGKNWFGSIYRPDCVCGAAQHWCPLSLHPWINVTNQKIPMGAYNVLVDLLGHPQLGMKTVVWLMDGLYGGPTQDPVDPVRFQNTPFNGGWSCSVFASQDPIALDSVAFDFLQYEPNIPMARKGCVDNYLHEAAMLPTPKSGTVYNPSGFVPLNEPLGCHEHWESPMTKRYSRNLGLPIGIELASV